MDLGKTVQLFKRNSRKRADLAEAPRPMVEKVVQIVINQCHESLEEIKFGLNCLYSDCFKVLQKCDNLKSIGLFSVVRICVCDAGMQSLCIVFLVCQLNISLGR